jgi:hypothetical protein
VRDASVVIPCPHVIVVAAVGATAPTGPTLSDVVRWVGVTVAVAGAVLATPEGIAAAWRWVRERCIRLLAMIRRFMHRPAPVVNATAAMSGVATLSGRAHAYRWQPWRQDAEEDEKIEILHKQVELLLEHYNELHGLVGRTADEFLRETHEVERRAVGHVQQLSSDLDAERSQASRVDARGLGPIALGVILTSLPDELATVRAVGVLAIVVAIVWTAAAMPSWMRDFRQALRRSQG